MPAINLNTLRYPLGGGVDWVLLACRSLESHYEFGTVSSGATDPTALGSQIAVLPTNQPEHQHDPEWATHSEWGPANGNPNTRTSGILALCVRNVSHLLNG
jgi:hypothetical protein